MSDKAKPKNPSEWVDSIGLRGAVAHLAELVYANSVSGSTPWQEIPDNIVKPEGYDVKDPEEVANPDPSGWQITRNAKDQKLWQVVDARNNLVAHKFPDRDTAQQYIDWGRANKTAKPIGNAKKS